MAKVHGCLLAALLLGGAACDGSGGDGRDREISGVDASTEEEVPDGGHPTEVEPPDCAHEITLAPEGGGFIASETVAALEVDGDGVDICLHLDGTANQRNHFASGSDQETGEASSFALLLIDQDGDVLVEGWDVTFGSEDPTSFANLEYGPWAPEVPMVDHVADVALRVTTKDGAPRTTSIDVALFDPLE